MLRLMFYLFCTLLSAKMIQGDMCAICNCVFVNISKFELKVAESTEIAFKYKAEVLEDFNSNKTYGALKKYFYVDCSSESNVGQMNNLDWPQLQVLGLIANFRDSKWKKVESFPDPVKQQMIVLSLYNNLITEIDEYELDSFTNLKMLNLSNNQIQFIKKRSFSKLSKLKYLDLSGNWITDIDEWAFYGTSLEYLNLSRNVISNLTTDVFRGLNNLTTLDLSENRLCKLSDDFVNHFPSLTSLILRKNGFVILPELPKDLKSFDVSYNQITDLHLSHPNLKTLYINNNKLQSLKYTNIPLLEVLKASHNNLTQLKDVNSNHIKILDLSYNKFNKIPEVVTSDKLPYLVEIYLDGNPISNISFNPQSEPMSNLKVVSLSHLKSVKKIIKNSFQGVFSITTYDCTKNEGIFLNLSHNSIKFVDKDAFQQFTVCSIDLSYNQLKSLSEDLLSWQKLSYVNLQENPWQCDCNIQWMLDEFLAFMYQNHPRLLFGLRCETPLRYRNKLFAFWYNKSSQVFCNSGPSSIYLDLIGGKKMEIWTVSAVTCVVLGIIILIIIIVIIVLACTKPKRKRRVGLSSKRKGPPYYSQIPNHLEEKNQNPHKKE